MKPKILLAALTIALNAVFHPVAQASNHPLNALRYDVASNIVTFDVAISVDWDYDNPPTRLGRALDRSYIDAVLQEFARSMWQTSEGRVRLGNVYVFKNGAYNRNISITILNRDGRASAHINGYGSRGYQAEHFVVYSGALESTFALGRTITHEMGHYLYGLFDEYVEAGKLPPSPGSPGKDDNAKPSMMNSHEEFVRFSTPGEYANPNERNTAHYRVFRESQWETLVRDPATDNETAKSESNTLPRNWIQSFRNIQLPGNAQVLRADAAGFDTNYRAVYMSGGFQKVAFLLDRSLPAAEFSSVKQAAAQAIRKQPLASVVSVYGFSATPGNPIVEARTLQTEADREAVLIALNAIEADTAGAVPADVDAAITAALAAVRVNFSAADVRNVFLLTRTSASVAEATASAAREQNTAITPLAVREGQPANGALVSKRAGAKSMPATGRTSLADLATATGGTFVSTKAGSELEAKSSIAAFEGQGGDEQAVAVAETKVLKRNETEEVAAPTHSQTDRSLTFQVSESDRDAGKLSYSLVAPNGNTITSAALPTGITYSYNQSSGVASFLIEPTTAGFNGVWKLRASAKADLVEPAYVETFVESDLNMTLNVTGDKTSDRRPLAIVAKVRGPQAVVGASVTVDLYDADGKEVKRGIVLRDNGVGADTFANDGLYSAALPSPTIGEYYIEATAMAANGVAKLSTSGSLRKGVNAADIPLPQFMRAVDLGFLVESLSTADLDKDGVPDNIEALENLDPYLKDNDVFASNRLFVMQAYRDFFGREGDLSGVTFWVNRLATGTATRATLAEDFLNSREFSGSVAPITRLYQAFFKRSPDFAGLNFWADRLRGGATLASVAESFAQSAEFISTYSQLSNSAFVDLVYRNVLDRAPDTAGRAFWLGELDARRITRGAMMAQFSESAEFVTAGRSRTFATLLYVGMLRRSPDTAGLSFWSDQFSRGVLPRVLVDAFIASTEYRARFLP
jgi:hypothetical protein